MLEAYFVMPSTVARLRANAVGAYLDDFVTHLHQGGYSRRTILPYVSVVEHFGDWIASSGVALGRLTGDSAALFFEHLSVCRCTEKQRGGSVRRGELARCAVRGFFKFLYDRGLASPEQAPAEPPMIAEFQDWMRRARGTSEGGLAAYRRTIVAFLASLDGDLARLDAHSLRDFVLRRASDGYRERPRNDAKALRMFVRFLSSTGRCRATLLGAIPSFASWKLATLPRYVQADDVERVIGSCDVASGVGLRDRAILLLLARLGLRAGDVRTLRLADVDWQDGSIRVAGKSRRETRLPLPQDAGDALLAYVEKGRPPTPLDVVFVRHKAPGGPLRQSSVSSIVRLAIIRSGVDAPSYGAHVLRHSAATQMLREGVSMQEIKAVLRHASLETTAIYAKVDTNTLKTLAQPWPEVAPC